MRRPGSSGLPVQLVGLVEQELGLLRDRVCAPTPRERPLAPQLLNTPIDADPRLGRLAVYSVAGEDLPHALEQLGGDPGDGGLSPWWIDQLLGWRLLAKVRNGRPLLRV